MLFEKSIIVLLVQLHFWETVRQFILRPVKNHPKIEVFIVMLMVPFLMNVSMMSCVIILLKKAT